MQGSESSKCPDSEKRKKGGIWQYKIYFDSEAAFTDSAKYDIKDGDGISELMVDGVNEEIKRVTAYELPLYWWQISKLLLYHMYIVFETENWWWSIEKDTNGIVIQRSKNEYAVRNLIRQEPRNSGLFGIGLTVMLADQGRMSVHDVLLWIFEADEVNNKYDYLFRNCRHFAKAVFNHVAKYKTIHSAHLGFLQS